MRVIVTCALACGSASMLAATDSTFLFGVWTEDIPHASCDSANPIFKKLVDSLHMNTVIGQCYTPADLAAYRNAGLKVIVFNVHSNPTVSQCASEAGIDSSFVWPYIYGRSVYRVWEAGAEPFDGCNLWYDERAVAVSDSAEYLLFRARDFIGMPPFKIQAGPDVTECCYAQEISWLKTIMQETENAHLYEVTMRVRLGEDPDPSQLDTIARVYVDLDSLPDYCETKGAIFNTDTLYIVDTTSTEFFWTKPLHYRFYDTVEVCADRERYPRYCERCDRECRAQGECRTLTTVDNVAYHVDYFASRDLAIDKVKLVDQYSPDLWEGELASQRLAEYTSRYFDTSATVLGWHIFDDQEICFNRNNALSAGKVDSLLIELTGKPGFVCPNRWATLFQEYYSGSSQFHFAYPVQYHHSSATDGLTPGSIQHAWEGGKHGFIEYLDINKRMAKDRGVNYYITLQGFEDSRYAPDNGRRPTAEENLCMVNLSLAYGVNGIFYWHFAATRYRGFVEPPGDETAPRSATWKQVDTLVGPWVERIGPKLVDYTWLGAAGWDGLRDSSFSLLDSIVSNEYGKDSAYVQVGFFEDTVTSEQLIFVVNRRCLPDERQNLKLYLKDEQKVSELLEKSLETCIPVLTFDTNGRLLSAAPDGAFSVSIDPGGAVLLRVSFRQNEVGVDSNSD